MRSPWADFVRPFTSPHAPNFSWIDFVRRWHGRKDAIHVRYEDLRRDTAGELRRIVLKLTGEQLSPPAAGGVGEEFSLVGQAGGQPGGENNRRILGDGAVGGWGAHVK